MRHAVIMAGGAGVRLWPFSRKNSPKQLLRLFDGKSLLRQSFERVASLLAPERINIITNESHLPIVAEELPELPAENLLGEPVGRDTANAVGMAAAVLAGRDAEAVFGIFTADHIISPIDLFTKAVERAYEVAEERPDALVTMGITPTRADTNYGYVRRGARIADGVFEVERFTEKPESAQAKEYLASGQYYWNSGMFVWRAQTILDQLENHLPDSHAGIMEIAAAWSTDQRKAKLNRIYPTLEKISIDFAVMERAERVLIVEMDCKWLDVGAWPAMEAIFEADTDGHVSVCGKAIHHASTGNIAVSQEDHLIATLGVDDLIIVHSSDATLVCSKREVHRLKELVEKVKEEFGEQYL